MAYVEVWKSGRLITRRRVDEQKAQKGCRVRLGAAGTVRVAVGQSEKLGKFEVRMFGGELPQVRQGAKETLSVLPQDDQSLPPLSVETPGLRTGQMDGHPEVPGYTIIERLGEGGMGVVWRAEQLSTRRQVALKLMVSHTIDSEKIEARFRREVELTARLDHANIARIYDSGLHQGMYYYAMELVDGMPPDQYVKRNQLSQNQILALMRTVCHALLYAHLRGVIHRDLKPSNILISPDGQPHVLDFGLAKALLEDDEALTISVEGQIAGTPAYMSPEQAAGHHSQTDTRTDVFSLGVILYELLTGQSPFDLSGSMFDLLHQITEGVVQRPSEIRRSVDCELEAILLKALALEPDDRYASAGALGRDIGNYLDGEPLDARVPTTLYFIRKKILKYKIQVSVAAAVLLVIFMTVVVAYTKIVTGRAANYAIRESTRKEIDSLSRELDVADAKLKILGEDKEEREAALFDLLDSLKTSEAERNQLRHTLGNWNMPVLYRRVGVQSKKPGTESALVRRPLCPDGAQSWTIEPVGHRNHVTQLTYSAKGDRLASASRDGTVRIWDADSGELLRIFMDPNHDVTDLSWSSKGKYLKVSGSGLDYPYCIWDVESGRKILAEPNNWNDTHGLSWSYEMDRPDREKDEVINLWKHRLSSTSRMLLEKAFSIALSPDGKMLACGDHDGALYIWSDASGSPVCSHAPSWCGPMHAVSFSPDGETLATCAGQGTVCLWEDRTWKPLYTLQASGITPDEFPGSNALGWAPDGDSLAILCKEDNVLLVLDAQSGQVLRKLEGNSQHISANAWSPDGRLLALAAADDTVKLWNVASQSNADQIVVVEYLSQVSAIAWTPDSKRVITGSADGAVRVCGMENLDSSDIIARCPNAIHRLVVSPDGKAIAFGSVDNMIRICDVDGTKGTVSLSEPNDTRDVRLTAIAWSPDGLLLASGYSSGVVRIWDNESRRSVYETDAACGSVNALTWSPDGQVLVGAGSDGTARIWNVSDNFEDCAVLLPLWGSLGPGMAIARGGDYRGPPEISDHIVYVVNSADGQTTLRPAEFESRHGWVNEAWQVGLHRISSEAVGRLYVKPDARGPCDGKRWDTAFDSLEEALSVAEPNTEIWVAKGTYRPTRGNGRSVSFRLKKGVKLIGGFSGTELNIDQRDPDKHRTILSGDLKGNDIPVSNPELLLNEPTRADNSYHVVLADEVDSGTVLDGFIITGGNANGPGPKRIENVHQHGGGCFVPDQCGLTLINCTIRFNASLGEGGAVYTARGRIILRNCTFVSNRASNGGAISAQQGKSTVISCAFTKNSANNSGGAVSTSADNSRFADCKFTENSGQIGGAVCTVYPEGSAIFANCRFLRNQADYGGGIYNRQCSPKLTNCLFNFNFGSGICNRDGSSPELVNCTIVGNRSRFPGCGIHSFDSEAEATCIPVLANCIVWDNIDETDTATSEQIYGGSPVVNNCCIQDWNDELGGHGNFGDSPLFIDPDGFDDAIGTDDDDFHLSPNSRCVNIGDDSMLPRDVLDLDRDGNRNESIPFDIEGKTRILGSKVDLGAYESR